MFILQTVNILDFIEYMTCARFEVKLLVIPVSVLFPNAVSSNREVLIADGCPK